MQEKIKQEKLEMRTFILFLLLVSIGFLWLLRPFFGPIFWACAIAVIFYPVKQKLLQRLNNRRNLTALLTLLLCVVIVVLPMIFVVTSAVNEGAAIYQKIEQGEIKPAQYIERFREAFPTVEQSLDRIGVDLNKLKETATDAAMSSGIAPISTSVHNPRTARKSGTHLNDNTATAAKPMNSGTR